MSEARIFEDSADAEVPFVPLDARRRQRLVWAKSPIETGLRVELRAATEPFCSTCNYRAESAGVFPGKRGVVPRANAPKITIAASRGTQTSAFGVGRRESHDSSAFYGRFSAPVLSDDHEVVTCPVPDTLWCTDRRDLSFLPDKCIALVVTSPTTSSERSTSELSASVISW